MGYKASAGEEDPPRAVSGQGTSTNYSHRMEALKGLSGVAATWVTILGALIGGIFALVEYRGQAHQERVAATLSYVQRFDSGPQLAAWDDYEDFWDSKSDEVREEHAQGNAQLERYVVQTITSNPHLQKNTRKLINFFEEIAACVCARVCDEAAAQEILGGYATEIYDSSAPYILTQRQKYSDQSYGKGLLVIGAHSFSNWRRKSNSWQCTQAGDVAR